MQLPTREILDEQYAMICNSRSVLFDYCDTVSSSHFLEAVPGFGRGGSIRNLLVHIVNTYRFWIGNHGFGREMEYASYDSITNMTQCRELYRSVDILVKELLNSFEEDYFIIITRNSKGRINSISPFKIFTHVTTHEFHHKGQILSISRHLGYIPVDTDIIR